MIKKKNIFRLSTEWSKLKNWNKVRNSLVHNNGIIKNEKDKDLILNLDVNVNKTMNLLTLEEDSIYVSELNCRDFLELSMWFFIQCLDGFQVITSN